MTQLPAGSPPVVEFVEVARSFCVLVGEHRAMPAARFLERVHFVLPRLYASALLLPSVGVDASDCDSSSKDAVLDGTLREHFREWDAYREIFDPYDFVNESSVVGSLADDISDIYAEIAGALKCWDAGNRDGALWTWRFGFQSHWGKHLTSALRALNSAASKLDLENGGLPP